MLGQSFSAYRHLVHAYRGILRRMHLKNSIVTVTLTSLVGVMPVAGLYADDDHPPADNGGDGLFGNQFPSSTPPLDPNGVFASAAASTVNTFGTQNYALVYLYVAGTTDMYHTPWSGGGTMYDYMLNSANLQRQAMAASSGGRMDLKIDVFNAPVILSPNGIPLDQNGNPAGPNGNGNYFLNTEFGTYLANQAMPDHTQYRTIGFDHSAISSSGYPVYGLAGGDYHFIEYPGYNRIHEFGHVLGLGHANSYGPSSGSAYTYDFTTKAYVPYTAADNFNAILTPFVIPAIGVKLVDYGSPLDPMRGGDQYQYNPRDKQSAGWLVQSQFADLGKIAVPGQTTDINLHYASELVVVSRGSGANLQYGVEKDYAADGNYLGSFVRNAQKFVQTSPTSGKWVNYAQVVDMTYVKTGASANGDTYGVMVYVDSKYIGVFQLGQVFDERTFAQYLFVNADGSPDLLALNPGAPSDPSRYRSTWYTLNYLADGVDATGHYGTLRVTSNSGVTLGGYRWDAAAGSAGAQDGSGAWSAAGGNFRDILPGTDNHVWNNDGSAEAVFGSASGAAGTVTVSGTVAAKSLTFVAPGAGGYTLTGGTIDLGTGGIIAESSATINSALNLTEQQVWSVSAGKTLNLGGVVTNPGGGEVFKIGQGDLLLSAANTWAGNLSLAEGRIRQTANQSLLNGKGLRLYQNTVYEIESGTLNFLGGSGVLAQQIDVDNAITYQPANNGALLKLSSTGSTALNPDLSLNGISVYVDTLLGAGLHYIADSTTTSSSSVYYGDITGTGGLAYHAGNSSRRLRLAGDNTFTGDLVLEKGVLDFEPTGKLRGNNVLTFNVGAGDTATFRTNDGDRNVRNLSSSGNGAAIITNNSAVDHTLTVQQDVAGTFSGTIIDGSTGRLALNKTGAQILALTGDNTYTGGTTVGAGVLRVSGGTALGTGTVELAGGTLSLQQRQGLLQSSLAGATLNTTDPGVDAHYSSNFSAITGQSSPDNTNQIFTGKIFLTAGQWSFGESYDDSAYVKINGQVILNNSAWFTPTYGSILIDADGWYDIDLRVAKDTGGAIGDSEGAWPNTKGIGIKKGAATAQASDYTAFGPNAEGIKLGVPGASIAFSNAITLAAASSIEVFGEAGVAAEYVLTGGVTGAAPLTKTGDGTLTFSGTGNTYTGSTTVTTGTVAAANANALSAASAFTLANTAGVALDLRGFNQTIGSLAGGGASGGNVLLGAGTLTAGGDNSSTAFAGVVSGTGGLTKSGAGIMTLSGQNTYTGTTKVAGGVLNLDYSAGADSSGIIASASALVLDHGVLRVTGRSGATITQNFASLEILGGANGVNLVRNGAAGLDVNIGLITRTGGGTIDFSGLTGEVQGARVLTSSGSLGALLDGGAQWATYNGTDWAAKDATNTYVVAYTGYTDVPTNNGVIPSAAAANVRITEGGPGLNTLAGATTTSVGSLLMSATGTASTVDMAGKTLSAPGIAVASGARRLTLGATAGSGTLTSATNALQLISNNANAANGLLVNAAIANNGGTPLAVSVSGGVNGGTTIFAGTNTYTGATAVTNNGVLQIGDGASSGTLGASAGVFSAVSVEAGSALAFNRSDTATVANAISGAGELRQNGTGTTVLTGANTRTGLTVVNAGTLQVGSGTSGGAGSGDFVIGATGTLTFGRTDAVTVGGAISGAGALSKTGGGVTTLTADSAGFSGVTTVSGGTLSLGAGGASGSLGSGAFAIDNASAALAVNRSDTVTLANAISGTGAFNQTGTGRTILTGNNAYGATGITAGTLQVGDGGTSGTLGTGAVNNAGALVFNRSDSFAVSAALGGAGTVLKLGDGTLALTGNNTNSGAITVAAGRLQVGAGGTVGTLGTSAVTLQSGSVLAFNRTDTVTVSNAVSGIGEFVQSGSGTLVYTGAGSWIGITRIESGTLQLGTGGSLGIASIANNGVLAFDRSDAYTLFQGVGGSGSLAQNGTGTLIVTANNTYAGGTSVGAGATLQLGSASNASLGTGTIDLTGTLSVSGAATGSITLAQDITGTGNFVQLGGTTRFSTAKSYTGTTTVNGGSLTLIGSSSAGSGDIFVNSGGSFTWDTSGSFVSNLANTITLDGGALRSISGSGEVNLNGGLVIASGGGTLLNSQSGAFKINGVLSGSGALTVQTVNGNNGRVHFLNAANTYSGTVTVREKTGGLTSASIVVGASTALRYATLDLSPTASDQISRNQIAYATGLNAFTLGGLSGNAWGGASLQNGSTAVALTVNQAADTAFAGVLSGTGSLAKTGSGSLTLSGQNTYTGATGVGGGTLSLDFSAAGAPASNIISATSALNMTGGTLKITGVAGQNGVVQTFAGLNVLSGDNTLQLVQGGATSIDVSIGALTLGGGSVNFAGLTGTAAGARVITTGSAGANDSATQLGATSALWNGTDWASVQTSGGVNYITKWTGSYTDIYTNAAGGATVIPNAATPADIRILDGGPNTVHNTLAASATTVGSLLMLSAGNAATIDMNSGDRLTVGTGVTGNIALVADARSLTIGQTAGQGTLVAGTAGNATLNLANANAASTLTVNAGVADNTSGAVSLVVGGPGAVVLNGPLAYTGSTVVGSGAALTINSALGGGSYSANILNNGVLNLFGSGVQTLSGAMSGSGSTQVRNGTVRLGADSVFANASAFISNGGVLDLNGHVAGSAVVNIEGLNALTNSSATRGTVLNLALTADTTIDNANAILLGSTTSTSGVLSLAGHTLTKNGAGVLLLNGLAATDAGNIVINAGTLRVSDYNVSARSTTLSGGGTITVNAGGTLDSARYDSPFVLSKDIVLNGGKLGSVYPGPDDATIASNIFVQSASSMLFNGGGYGGVTFSGVISGSGALTVGGDGATRTFTGDSSYSGNITLGGAMAVAGSGRLGSGNYGGALTLNSGANFTYGSSANQTFSGGVSGAGRLTGAGTGVLTLAANTSYTGGTILNGGTLLLNATHTMGSGVMTVNAGARLGGSGSFTTSGATTVASGATLRGGDGTLNTTLTITNSAVTLASGSIIELALGGAGAHSTLAHTGTGGITFDDAQKFSFLDFGATVGTYQNLITGVGNSGNTSGWTLTNAGWTGSFQYDGTGNIDFVLTAVPEPATYGLIGAGALAAVAAVRRRRKAA